MNRPRVLLGDDHQMVTEGLRRILDPEFEIVAAVDDGQALVRAVAEHNPDVVVTDISMPLLNGVDAARRIGNIAPATKIIFLTMHTDANYVRETFAAGAAGYVVKHSAAAELVTAIREVLKGRSYISPQIAKTLVDLAVSGPPSPQAGFRLTLRPREIVQMVAEGFTAKEIARRLKISPRTVEDHKARIMAGLGIHSTAALTQYAMRQGLVSE